MNKLLRRTNIFLSWNLFIARKVGKSYSKQWKILRI